MADDAEPPVKVVVEVPKGSRNKYEYNHETGAIELDRRLFAAVNYPTEYGFIPETKGGDGDELDALVCVTEPTFPGCMVPANPIGVLRMHDGERRNSKVICVPLGDPAWSEIEDIGDLPGQLADEIVHFFDVYTDLEGQDWKIEGWASRPEALDEIDRARERYREDGGDGGDADGEGAGGEGQEGD